MAKQQFNRLDANESAYFAKQLTFIEKKVRESKLKDLRFSKFIPVSTEVPSGTESIVTPIMTGVGVAKIISNYAKDFPRVDIYGEEITRKVKDLGSSFGYTTKDIRRASMSGISLNPSKAKFAKRAIDQSHNAIALVGDEDAGLRGLINYPNITEFIIPEGASSSKLWSSKTPDEILADMNGAVGLIIQTTNGVENPNQILLPLGQYRHISVTPRSSNSDVTILEFFLKSNPGVSVDWLNELDGAGVDGADIMMVYVRDIDNLRYDAPVMFESLPAEREGMEYTVKVHGETAGVVVYFPLSVCSAQGI